jgi:hypothetical protein
LLSEGYYGGMPLFRSRIPSTRYTILNNIPPHFLLEIGPP